MSLFSKAKEKVAEVKADLDAADRRITEDNARKPKPQPAKPNAEEQDRIRREGEFAALNNQQQGLVD